MPSSTPRWRGCPLRAAPLVSRSSPGCISTIRTRPTSRRRSISRRPAATPTTARSRSPTRRSAGCSTGSQSSGLTRDTVVAIAGDHGEGLGDHGELTHGMLAYDSTLRVPLIVLAVPGRARPAVDDQPVSLGGSGGDAGAACWRPCQAGCMPASLLAGPVDRARSVRGDAVSAERWLARARALADDRWKLIAVVGARAVRPHGRSGRARQPRGDEAGESWRRRERQRIARSAASEHRRRRLFLPSGRASARVRLRLRCGRGPPTARPRQIPRRTSPRGTRSSVSSRG